MEVVRAAQRFRSRTAVVAASQVFSYGDVLDLGAHLAQRVKDAIASDPEGGARKPHSAVMGPRVAVMAHPGPEYVAAMFGTWLSGGVAVPLALSHPPAELAYVLQDAGVSVVLAQEEFAAVLRPLLKADGCNASLVDLGPAAPGKIAPPPAGAPDGSKVELSSGALIIYTSGTTGRPKGALHTHQGISAQVHSLCSAWEWAEGDRIVHPLPMHHIHGIVNAWLCAHRSGAAVEFVPKFSPSGLWHRLRDGNEGKADRVTVFMGVPTMYVRLLQVYDGLADEEKKAAAAAARALRLAVSGSAACPVPLMKRWEEVTGERLLERYGMTEIGMALSNPLRGERRPGFVGVPLPGVEVKVVAEDGTVSADGPGELRVKGPAVFKEYIGRPESTKDSFDEEGYFKTGDTVLRESGSWQILGRTSVDILKCGGYKLSALEIEGHLLDHPGIAECAVVGVPDEAYGQVVAAVLVGRDGKPPPTLPELRQWARDVMAPYKVPTQLRVLADALPRNAMGKVNKKELLKLFTEAAADGEQQASKKPRLEEQPAADAGAAKK